MAAARKGAVAAEALHADAQHDPNLPVTVPLDGTPCTVKPMRKWRSSGLRALRTGDFETWAETCLDDSDYVEVWQVIDPDVDMVEAFFEAWAEITGQNAGKSRALSR